MKKLFILLSVSTAAMAAAPSASFAKLVLDLPPILAGGTANSCNSSCGTVCMDNNASCTNCCDGTCSTTACGGSCNSSCGTICMDNNASCTSCCDGTCSTTACGGSCNSSCGTVCMDNNASCTNCCDGTCQTTTCNAVSTTGLLNDTGITWSGTGATGNNAGTTCSDLTQDCSYGWDKTDGSNAADGHAGFKFTKLDSNGNVTTGTSFECVQDERTGLIWEVKSSTSASWSAAKTNAASFTACNVAAGKWRLPTVKELLGIVSYYNVIPSPAVDTAYFPGTASLAYWTSTEVADSDADVEAWVVNFATAMTAQQGASNLKNVRFVHDAP